MVKGPKVLAEYKSSGGVVFRVLEYRTNSRAVGFVVREGADVSEHGVYVYGCPDRVDVVMRLRGGRQIKRVCRILNAIERNAAGIIGELDIAFWAFLTIYTEQRHIIENPLSPVLSRWIYEESNTGRKAVGSE